MQVQKSWLRLPALLKSCPSSSQVPASLFCLLVKTQFFPGTPGIWPCLLLRCLVLLVYEHPVCAPGARLWSGTLTPLSTWLAPPATLVILFKVATPCQGEWIGEEIFGEFGMHMCMLLHLKWITMKVLLYSTWDSAWCCVWSGEERSLGKMDTYICLAESFCCSPETVTTLSVNWLYPNMK